MSPSGSIGAPPAQATAVRLAAESRRTGAAVVNGTAADGPTASWTVDLASGEAAGVSLVSGTARLNPTDAFLAPVEEGTADEAGAAEPTAEGAPSGPATAETATPATAAPQPAATVGSDVPTGLLTLLPQRLTLATNRIDTAVRGMIPAGTTATVDVRGRNASGEWSEWIPTTPGSATVTLPELTTEVQGRLVLTGRPMPVVVDGGTTTSPTPATTTARTTTAAPTPSAASTTRSTAPSTSRSPSATTSPRPSSSTAATTTPRATTSGTTTSPSRPATTTSAAPTTTSRTTTSAPSTPAAGGTTDGPSVDGVTLTAHTAKPTTSAAASKVLTSRVFATREGLVGRTTANGHKITKNDKFVALPSRRALSPRGTNDYSVKVCAANGKCAYAPVWDVGPWNTRDDYWNESSKRENWKDLPRGMPEAQAAKEKGYNGGRDQFKRKVANPAGIDLADGLFWGSLGLKDNSWVTVSYLWTGSTKLAKVTSEESIRQAPEATAPVVGIAALKSSVPVECVFGSGANRWLRIGVDQYVSSKAVSDLGQIGPCTGAAPTTSGDQADKKKDAEKKDADKKESDKKKKDSDARDSDDDDADDDSDASDATAEGGPSGPADLTTVRPTLYGPATGNGTTGAGAAGSAAVVPQGPRSGEDRRSPALRAG